MLSQPDPETLLLKVLLYGYVQRLGSALCTVYYPYRFGKLFFASGLGDARHRTAFQAKTLLESLTSPFLGPKPCLA